MPNHASGQPLPEWVTWDCCDQVHDDGTPCTGAAQADSGRCLVHLDATQLAEVLAPRPDEAPPDLDGRGARLTADGLERVLAAARRSAGALDELPPISLSRALVTGAVTLDLRTVRGDVSLDDATVEGDVSLSGGWVLGNVSFDGATVKGDVFLDDATVEGTMSLRGATLEGEALLGPRLLSGSLSLARAEFARLATLEVIAQRVDLSGARLLGGLTARVGEAEVEMELVEVQGHAVLADIRTGLTTPEPPPRLLQLTGTDVARLTLTGVDLAACHFSGTINLDELRIDGSPQLAVRGGWRRARRRVLAEEHVWRYVHGPVRRRNGWYPLECRPRDPAKAQEIIREAEATVGSPRDRAQEIASVYRALRKGREDAKDEPGAADFYYGEMEMRRAGASGFEWALLTLYWLLSGYGLRASRSLAAFAGVVTVFAGLLYGWGFKPASAPDVGGAFVYSLESATAFFRGPGPELLTEWGRVFQVCLRLLGPALLALTVLAVRGRVKR